MSQRAFCLVIASESPQASDWLARLLPQARSGPLTPRSPPWGEGSARGAPADPGASLAHKEFFEALCEPRRALCLCAVGNEWLGALPRRFSGLAVGENARGSSPKVLPRVRAAHIRSLLQRVTADGCEAPGLRRLSVAKQLVLCEPWDVFFLWLPLAEAHLPQGGQRLGEMLSWLTPDIAVCGVVVTAGTDSQFPNSRKLVSVPACRWFWRLHKGGCEPLPPRPVEDVLPSLLSVLGINAPPALPGTALDLQRAGASSGYTPDDERAIQKRLEDLGYL